MHLNRHIRTVQELAAKQRVNVLLPADEQQQQLADGDGDNVAGGEGGYQQQASAERSQQQLRQSLEFERGLLLEREERMSNIQSSVLDINAIMQQLGSMTEQQGTNIGTCIAGMFSYAPENNWKSSTLQT